MKHLQENLLKLWANNQIGHFYILRTASQHNSSKDLLVQWIHDFLKLVFQAEKSQKIPPQHHPDVLWMERTPEQKNWLVEDFQIFFRFLNLTLSQISRKWVVVEAPHLINEILANKLLKSLEEPFTDKGKHPVTIFFLEETNRPLLPTVEGRGISLKIALPELNQRVHSFQHFTPSEDRDLWLHWLEQELQGMGERGDSILGGPALEIITALRHYLKSNGRSGRGELWSLIKQSPLNQKVLLEIILQWERGHQSNYFQKLAIVQAVQNMSLAQKYNFSDEESFFHLISAMCLPRQTARSLAVSGKL